MEKQQQIVPGHLVNRLDIYGRLLLRRTRWLGLVLMFGFFPLPAGAEPAGDARVEALQATLARQNEEVQRLKDQVLEQREKLQLLQGYGIPIGAVVPFFLTPSETRKLEPFWLPADGRVVVDLESPLNGRRLPDLVERMVLGKSANLDVSVSDATMEGGSQILNLSLPYSGSTTGAQFPWGAGGRIPQVFEPEFTIDTTVDELKHANHRHDYSGSIRNQVTLPLPPFRGLVYMVRVR